VPKELLKPAQKLDGKWKIVAYESNGRAITTSSILNQTWAFDGEQLAITRPPVGKGAVTPAATKIGVRADAKTKEFDYVMAGGTTRLGRYQIDGDTLTINLTINTSTGERPADVAGGTGTLKYTFKRADKTDDKK
jgi:uncharacterized protein (TIGR03067 family)